MIVALNTQELSKAQRPKSFLIMDDDLALTPFPWTETQRQLNITLSRQTDVFESDEASSSNGSTQDGPPGGPPGSRPLPQRTTSEAAAMTGAALAALGRRAEVRKESREV